MTAAARMAPSTPRKWSTLKRKSPQLCSSVWPMSHIRYSVSTRERGVEEEGTKMNVSRRHTSPAKHGRHIKRKLAPDAEARHKKFRQKNHRLPNDNNHHQIVDGNVAKPTVPVYQSISFSPVPFLYALRRFCNFVVLFTRLQLYTALQTVAGEDFSIQQKVIPLARPHFSPWKTLPVKQRFLTLSTGFSTESRGKHAIQSVKLCGNVESSQTGKNYTVYRYSCFFKKSAAILSRNMQGPVCAGYEVLKPFP